MMKPGSPQAAAAYDRYITAEWRPGDGQRVKEVEVHCKTCDLDFESTMTMSYGTYFLNGQCPKCNCDGDNLEIL